MYFVEDHVEALKMHSKLSVDVVVMANDVIPKDVLKRYQAEETHPIVLREEEHDYPIIAAELLAFNQGLITHDSIKVANILNEYFFKE